MTTTDLAYAEEFSYGEMKKLHVCKMKFNSASHKPLLTQMMSSRAKDTCSLLMEQWHDSGVLTKLPAKCTYQNWLDWPDETFFQTVFMNLVTEEYGSSRTIHEEFLAIKIERFDPMHNDSIVRYFDQITDVRNRILVPHMMGWRDEAILAEEHAIVKKLLAKFRTLQKNIQNFKDYNEMVQDKFEEGKKYSLKSFCNKVLLKVSMDCVKGLTKFKCFVFKDGVSKPSFSPNDQNNHRDKKKNGPGGGKQSTQSTTRDLKGSSKTKRSSDSTSGTTSPAKKQLTACYGCGHAFHVWENCLYNSPQFQFRFICIFGGILSLARHGQNGEFSNCPIVILLQQREDSKAARQFEQNN